MVSINFYLKSVTPNKKGQVPVIAQVAHDYKKIRKQIGKTKPGSWNKKSQRLKLPAPDAINYDEFASFNRFLETLQNEARELSNKLILEKRQASETEIRQILSLEQSKINPEPGKSFFELFDDFIIVQKAILAPNTVRGMETVRNFLFDFKRDTGFSFTFSKIDVHFGDLFSSYCFNDRRIDNDYYVKIINVFKKFFNWAKSRGYHEKEFPDIQNGIREKENDVVFLTIDELMIFYNYDFESERLGKLRDMYCFSCFTGFRHCDVKTLKKEHVNEAMVTKTQNKTRKQVKIPLNKYAKAILEKYKDQESPLHKLTNQKANDYLKECLKYIANDQEPGQLFNRKIIKKKVIGHRVEEEAVPLYEGITFHSARKTFITNSMILGANLQVLQEMGAPKKQRDLAKYLKITEAYKNQVMQDTWDKLG